jgi:hypothetical protein
VATLSVPGSQTVVSAVAVSGQTVVASGYGGGDAGAYVFSEPAGGWSSEAPSATLVDSGGAVPEPTAVAASGQAVVVNEDLPDSSFEDVFVEPSGGWSGTVAQSARLVASDGAVLYAPSISGATVVANGSDPSTDDYAVYVFNEPAGGWSGTVHEVAKLADPVASLGYAAVSGQTIVGSGGARANVYREPAGGWTSNVSPAARLSDPSGFPLGSLMISGQTILAFDDVFVEPAGGWSGNRRPSARLFPASQISYGLGCCEAFSGATAVQSADILGSEHQCPCSSVAWLFSEPADGWKGTIVATPAVRAVTESGPLSVAVEDPYLFTAGSNTIQVSRVTGTFGYPVRPPSVAQKGLSGLLDRRPRLHFKLTVGVNNPRIKAVRVVLPHGLSFAKNRKKLAAGVSIAGTRNPSTSTVRSTYKLALRRRQLYITLAQPLEPLAIAVRPPALAESTTLLRRIHKAKPAVALPIGLRVTDFSGGTFTVILKVHPR